MASLRQVSIRLAIATAALGLSAWPASAGWGGGNIWLSCSNGQTYALSARAVAVDGGTVTLIGAKDIQSDLAPDATKLYAMNCANFTVAILEEGDLVLDFDDELVAGSVITHDGRILSERVAASLPVPAEERPR